MHKKTPYFSNSAKEIATFLHSTLIFYLIMGTTMTTLQHLHANTASLM